MSFNVCWMGRILSTLPPGRQRCSSPFLCPCPSTCLLALLSQTLICMQIQCCYHHCRSATAILKDFRSSLRPLDCLSDRPFGGNPTETSSHFCHCEETSWNHDDTFVLRARRYRPQPAGVHWSTSQTSGENAVPGLERHPANCRQRSLAVGHDPSTRYWCLICETSCSSTRRG